MTRPADRAPFFVVGFQRSGTTLLRMMLDSHPRVAVPLDTTGLWARYDERQGEFGALETPADRRRMVEALLGEERIRLWETELDAHDIAARVEETGGDYPSVVAAFHRAYAEARGKDRWGSKDPGDMLRIDRIHGWFPEARFVHLVRDGRDACLSQRDQPFGHDDLLACGADWRQQVWWVRRIGRILGPGRYHEMRYEDLVTDPEAELRSLCRMLDLEFDPAMLSYHRRVEEAIPAEKRYIWPLIDSAPRRDNVEKWREAMSEGERICFEKRARDVLEESGYEVRESPPRGAYATEIASHFRRLGRVLRRRIGMRNEARPGSSTGL